MLNKLLEDLEGKLNTSKWAKITKTSTDTRLERYTKFRGTGCFGQTGFRW